MVYIKKVEIFGFKSFGFKNTIVDFQPGLISISGPNGSGKSNILDAIIFAMGENSPKMMRVDRLLSLLHDIEGRRGSSRMARCSIHFDNSDRKIPVDSDTVKITREMDQNGENVYYIDKKKKQRRDILNILNIANASLSQLNAVQQGTITKISDFSSEDKRKAIEDIIGLSDFDDKKKKSEEELKNADHNLDKAFANKDLIKDRIDKLEKDRNEKLRYDLLQYEINRLSSISAINEIKKIDETKTSKESDHEILSRKIKGYNKSLEIVNDKIQDIAKKKSRQTELFGEVSTKRKLVEQQISNKVQDFNRIKNEIVLEERRISIIDKRLSDIDSKLIKSEKIQNDLQEDLVIKKEEINKTKQSNDEINNKIQDLDTKRSSVLKQQSVMINKKIKVDEKIKKLYDNLNSAKILKAELKLKNQDVNDKIRLNTIKKSNCQKGLTTLSALKQRLETIKTNHDQKIIELKSYILKRNSNKEKILKDINEFDSILKKSTKTASQYKVKLDIVKNIMHEEYSIAKLKENSKEIGIKGLVYELVTWDKKYERAILSAGSDWIKAILVRDFRTLLNVAEYARFKNLPKLKIIPYDIIPKFNFNINKEHLKQEKIIGILSDFVNCDPKYPLLKTFLFGNVILTETSESAQNISKKGFKAVTLNGEFFEPNTKSAIIDINSKISKLTKIISMSDSIKGLLQSISLLEKYIQKRKDKFEKIDNFIVTKKDKLNTLEKELAITIQSNNDLKNKIKSTIKLYDILQNRLDDLSHNHEKINRHFTSNESYIISLNERIRLVKENYLDGKQQEIADDISIYNEKKSDLEFKRSQISDQLNKQSSNIATLSSKKSSEEQKIYDLEDEQKNLKKEKQDIEEKLGKLEPQKKIYEEDLIKLRDEENKLISFPSVTIDSLNQFDDGLRSLNKRANSFTRVIGKLEKDLNSLSRDIDDLKENRKSLQKTLDVFEFTKEEDVETYDVEKILSALRAEQKSITYLNAKAPTDYINDSKEYRVLSERNNILIQERDKILKFIADIDRDKRQTFLNAFDSVDKEIRSIFSKMTGGNAWLELQNEDNIFNSGISYLIQFPNKPKRESTSISGGEKTLAAIVFVLALQKLEPSPFYLFDEVDAHLDAPNSERLANILEERSKESQFIMVSLKDMVVKKAGLIYGVYPKKGVSHIINYKDKRLPSMSASNS